MYNQIDKERQIKQVKIYNTTFFYTKKFLLTLFSMFM